MTRRAERISNFLFSLLNHQSAVGGDGRNGADSGEEWGGGKLRIKN
jgi:hypothetical protein